MADGDDIQGTLKWAISDFSTIELGVGMGRIVSYFVQKHMMAENNHIELQKNHLQSGI